MLCAFVICHTVAVAPVFMPNWHSDDEHSRTHLHQKHVCNVVCVWPIGRAVVHFGVGGMHGRSIKSPQMAAADESSTTKKNEMEIYCNEKKKISHRWPRMATMCWHSQPVTQLTNVDSPLRSSFCVFLLFFPYYMYLRCRHCCQANVTAAATSTKLCIHITF